MYIVTGLIKYLISLLQKINTLKICEGERERMRDLLLRILNLKEMREGSQLYLIKC